MSEKYALDVMPGDILDLDERGPVLVDYVFQPSDDYSVVVISGYDPDGDEFDEEFDPDDVLTVRHNLAYLWD